ncbi:MAG: N-acetylglucosamine-6-phosphate deacetylase [Lachnospiraceae bacterium]|nr:N-acetylglucosamine-6-phosphate deacetylase [Lachnospiraceae bacterium]MBR5944652.1 N-acetylglucosamine-6-phosphate deacetylase [Lachnospiraceae bacterium]
MIVKNVNIFRENGTFEKGDIIIEKDRFATETTDETVIDGNGCYAIPGLTDVHFHGCVGYDFCDGTEEAIQAMAEYELANGVTAINPATMTLPEETIAKVARAAAAHKNESGADLVGINMEGPFINPEKKGAQDPQYMLDPNVEMFRRLQKEANGLFKICDIAPERNGALEFIDALKNEVRISVAHTAANYDEAKKAFDHGASQVTHLYNAMNPLTHRAPGVIGAASENENVFAELICDGVHIHPAAIKAAFKMFGDDRIILISDSMMATGKPDGQYSLGGQDVTVKGSHATLTEGGALAGSVTNLMNCMRFVVKTVGISLGSAVKCAAVNPAKSVGIYDNYGSITAGKLANLVLLDDNLDITHIIKKGTVVR